ncbi:hypothetical protein D922_02906, partial [Enterococcus faecalis 06-MB-DW-09]
ALRNQYYYDHEIRWNPVAKLKKEAMIDYATNLFSQGRFFYVDNENNTIFVEEHKKYRWDEKKVAKGIPEVVKEDDHTCDAFQYFCIDNAKELGLMV